MEDYYKILGVTSSATLDEIRRAYRILARRYHPDVNPQLQSDERFKKIAEAYRVLTDERRRKEFDAEFQRRERQEAARRYRAYAEQARQHFHAQSRRFSAEGEPGSAAPRSGETRRAGFGPREAASAFLGKAKSFLEKELQFGSRARSSEGTKIKQVRQISIIEVSLTIQDAIQGVRKTIEIQEPEGPRKVSVRIPPGMKPGEIIRLRNRDSSEEELILVIRVAQHPFLSFKRNGLVVEIPVTLAEAACGASIPVPTLEDPVLLKIPPGSQSGTEFRLRGRGITNRNGEREDLFFKILIQIPENGHLPEVQAKAGEIEPLYEVSVRKNFPRSLLDL